MKQKRKIYVVGGDIGYANWMQGSVVSNMDDANLVVFTGGEDVTPALYGARPHPTTAYNWRRDEAEIAEYERALALGLPMIGICRGSQFLCVMAGGSLVQHQQHPGEHEVHTEDGRVIRVTSTHHQRQNPWARRCPATVVLAWANDLSPFSYGESNNEVIRYNDGMEVEVAYYPTIRALAIQSHPEYVFPPKLDWHRSYIAYCQEMLNKLMDNSF